MEECYFEAYNFTKSNTPCFSRVLNCKNGAKSRKISHKWIMFQVNNEDTRTASLTVWKFIEKKFQHRCFPANVAKFLRTAFFVKHFSWLLLRENNLQLIFISLGTLWDFRDERVLENSVFQSRFFKISFV